MSEPQPAGKGWLWIAVAVGALAIVGIARAVWSGDVWQYGVAGINALFALYALRRWTAIADSTGDPGPESQDASPESDQDPD